MTDQLAGWLTDGLTDRPTTWTDWLIYQLTDWLAGWLTGWSPDCLTDWLPGWLTYRLTGWLAGRCTDWPFDRLADYLTDNFLIYFFAHSFICLCICLSIYLPFTQQLQFAVILMHTTSALFLDCGFNLKLLMILWFYCISLILLFTNFYLRAYLSKEKKSE